MTFVQPNENNLSAMNILLFSMTLVLLGVAVFGVFIYNELVNLRHDVTSENSDIKKTEVENAELKNNFYVLVDTKNFALVAENSPLVIDNNPEYLKAGPRVSSNY